METSGLFAERGWSGGEREGKAKVPEFQKCCECTNERKGGQSWKLGILKS